MVRLIKVESVKVGSDFILIAPNPVTVSRAVLRPAAFFDVSSVVKVRFFVMRKLNLTVFQILVHVVRRTVVVIVHFHIVALAMAISAAALAGCHFLLCDPADRAVDLAELL